MELEKLLKISGLGVGVLLACAKTIHEFEKWMATREERQRKSSGKT